jgi:glyoxylate reductase
VKANKQFCTPLVGDVLTKPKVYITRALPKRGLDLILGNFDAQVWPQSAPPPREVLLKNAKEVDALVTLLSDKIDVALFDAAPKLKIVAQMAVGFDNVDLQEATKRGIYITNTPDVLTQTTADFAWTLLMAIARRVVEADQYVRRGNWEVAWHPDMMVGRDIHDATIGIVGAGRIGQAIAQRAHGFNMKILYSTPLPRPELDAIGAKQLDLDGLLRLSDFVTLHVPLTKETTHLINAEKLALMKSTAYLINTSRGPVIDEKALYHALKSGKIAGAAIDVFEQEPTPKNNPLLGLDNIVVAPHISSASIETRSRMAELVAQNLIAFFRGEKPPNLLNLEVLKTNPLRR